MESNRKELLLIFDLDGTLWDSSKQLAESWNIVLQSTDLKGEVPVLTAKSLLSVLGKTMDDIADALLPGLDEAERRIVFQKCEEFENIYITEHGGVLFPDVEKTLWSLSSRGYKMTMVSNCQKGYIPAFFTWSGLGHYFFDYEEWGRTGRSKAENIRLVMERNGFLEAIYIGDTVGDYRSATDAGIPFIHAAYGFGEVPEADRKIGCFRDLLTLLPE